MYFYPLTKVSETRSTGVARELVRNANQKTFSELLNLNLHFNKVPSASPIHMEVLEALIENSDSKLSEHPDFTVGSLFETTTQTKP